MDGRILFFFFKLNILLISGCTDPSDFFKRCLYCSDPDHGEKCWIESIAARFCFSLTMTKTWLIKADRVIIAALLVISLTDFGKMSSALSFLKKHLISKFNGSVEASVEQDVEPWHTVSNWLYVKLNFVSSGKFSEYFLCIIIYNTALRLYLWLMLHQVILL